VSIRAKNKATAHCHGAHPQDRDPGSLAAALALRDAWHPVNWSFDEEDDLDLHRDSAACAFAGACKKTDESAREMWTARRPIGVEAQGERRRQAKDVQGAQKT